MMTMILALLLAGEPLVTTRMADPDPGYQAPKAQPRVAPKRKRSAEEDIVRAAVAFELDRLNTAAAQQRADEEQAAELEEMARASLQSTEQAGTEAEAAAAPQD
jgi:hypothetical protein